jgi:hypothetical protein
MAEYNKKKLEQEAEERHATRMHNSPYVKSKKYWKNLKLSRMPMKNKNDSGRFSGRQP